MADDARISTALPRHPKTVKLMRRTQERGAWALVCLFLWVAENRPDGNLEGLTGEDIEIAAGWLGTPGEFIRALTEVRFLDGQENSYRVHDWAEHNPWAATRPQRIQQAKKAASARWEKMQDACSEHAPSNADSCNEHVSAMPSSPLHHSPPHTTKSSPLEEKVLSCALEENHHARVSRDEAPGIPPDSPESRAPNDLSPFSYGAKICDDLGLPLEGNVRAFGGAIEALIKKGKAPAAAYEFLLARAKDAQEMGELTRPAFWCRDGTYNQPAGHQYLSRAERETEAFLARHRGNGGGH